MRAAQRQAERDAIAARLANAEASAKARGCADVLVRFRDAIKVDSRAVICRGIAQAQALVSDDNQLYPTFYEQVMGGARRPEDGGYDQLRQVVDSAMFPGYHQHIRFGALSLDGCGPTGYGNCSFVLKNVAIEDRATVFEENSVFFFGKQKYTILQPDKIDMPPGFRAPWQHRDELAASKLAGELDAKMKAADFAGVLLRSSADRKSDEFIEVHVYGTFNRDSIERVCCRKPKRKADNVLLMDLGRKLRKAGIGFDVYS